MAHEARTLDELAAVVHDLPAGPSESGRGGESESRRELLILFAIAAATLLALGLFMALSR
jgi:hypothetical protein